MTNKEFEKFENDLNDLILKMINLQKKNLDLKNKRSIALKDKKLLKNQTTQLIIIVGN